MSLITTLCPFPLHGFITSWSMLSIASGLIGKVKGGNEWMLWSSEKECDCKLLKNKHDRK